jgi:succinate dehydrogenase / fumarate reductase, cytochrome b subunit
MKTDPSETPAPTRQISRPMSPFMLGPYYRFQLTSVLSFAHRLTGLGLSFGTLLIGVWLVALASGAETYSKLVPHLQAWYGKALMFAFAWTLMYHLCNGIRHLFWDTGRGFDIPTAYKSGYAVVAASLVLTAGIWLVALGPTGGAS